MKNRAQKRPFPQNGLDSVEDFMDTIQEATVSYLAMANYCYIIEELGMVMS
jgi:hypothetical protein